MNLSKSVFIALLSFTFLFACQKEEGASPSPDSGVDLATEIAGDFQGALILGSGLKSNYTVSVTRIGKNKISVKGEDSEFPTFSVEIVALKSGGFDWIVEKDDVNSIKGVTYSRPDNSLMTHDDVNDVQFSGQRKQ